LGKKIEGALSDRVS